MDFGTRWNVHQDVFGRRRDYEHTLEVTSYYSRDGPTLTLVSSRSRNRADTKGFMNTQHTTEQTDYCNSKLAIRPILYTDTVEGKQTHRDDLWAVSTSELNELEQRIHTAEERARAEEKQRIIEIIKQQRSLFVKNKVQSRKNLPVVRKARDVLRIEILEDLGEDCTDLRKLLTDPQENSK